MDENRLDRIARAISRRVATPPSDETRTEHLASVVETVAADNTGTIITFKQRCTRTVRSQQATRRLVSVAAAAVLVMAIVATPLVNAPGDDLPMLSAAGRPASPASSGADALMERSDAATDSFMWLPTNYMFRLDDGVDIPAGKAPAWRLEIDGTLPQYADLLSAYFDLPAATPSEWDPQTRIAGDEQQRSVTLYPAGEWYYSNFAAYPQWSCPGSADGVAPDMGDAPSSSANVPREPAMIDEPCTAPPAAQNLPSVTEATRRAEDVFEQLGITHIRFEEPFRDDWTVSLWGTQQFAELPGFLGQGVSITFGANGEILGAYGSFARPVLLGEYPTVSAAAAVERLNEQFNGKDGFAGARPAPMIDGDQPVTDTMEVPEVIGEEEPVLVTIVSVSIVPSMLWSPDGFTVIAPHYRMVDASGQEWWVAAVTDKYLAG